MAKHSFRDGIEGKACTKCGEWKSLDKFYAKPTVSDGRAAARKACTLCQQREARPHCVDCGAPIDHEAVRCVRCNGLKQRTNNRAKHYAVKDGMEGKTCTKCHEWKPPNEYAKRSQNPDGLSYRCKGCLRERHLQYVATHREEIRAQQRRCYEKNKEVLSARMHEYNEAHKKELSDYKKAWAGKNKEGLTRKRREYYLENCERLKAYSLQWSRENPDKKHEYRARRRAREASGIVETVDIQAIYERDGNCCVYCGRTEDPTIDHVEPLAKGGAHHKDNLVVARKKCNSEKNTKWLGVGGDHWLPWEWHGPFPYEGIYQTATP